MCAAVSAFCPVKPLYPFLLVSQKDMCMFLVFSYFRSLVEQFEVQLQQYRQQIEELENHLTTQSSGSHITPQGKNICLTLDRWVITLL